MNVTISEIFEHERAQLDVFQANDLERFIERTRNGHIQGFAQHVTLFGVTCDGRLAGIARNGEAACEFVWANEDVLFTRALAAPTDMEKMPMWLQDLFR